MDKFYFCCSLCGDHGMIQREDVEYVVNDQLTLSVFDCQNCTYINYIDVKSTNHIE